MKTLSHTKRVSVGDRIYARLMFNGKSVVEIVEEGVSSISEILGKLRHVARSYSGLASIQIRNMSRGWSMESPLMLYAESRQSGDVQRVAKRRMLMPWETH